MPAYEDSIRLVLMVVEEAVVEEAVVEEAVEEETVEEEAVMIMMYMSAASLPEKRY